MSHGRSPTASRASFNVRDVLPAWATITLSIVSALAGIVGGVAVTQVRIWFDREQAAATRDHERRQQEVRLAHEREEQWRDRLVDAAAEFSTGAQQALLRVHEAIQAAGQVGEQQRAVGEARRVIEETGLPEGPRPQTEPA